MTHTTKLLICIALYVVIYLGTPSARACEAPGPCYDWDEGTQTWEAYGCVETPCTEDCEYCDETSCGCEPTCVDPTADFTINTDPVYIGTLVNFDASASDDPDDTTLTYTWDFGDNAFDISADSTDSPTCRYLCIGDKTVELTVSDNDDPDCSTDCSDGTDSTSQTVTVTLPAGCSQCTGQLEISLGADIQEAPQGTHDGCVPDGLPCGLTGPAVSITTDVLMPCYQDCAWEFGATATADYEWGVCDFIDVLHNPEAVNTDNFCEIIDAFMYGEDLEPQFAPGTGCAMSDMVVYSVYVGVLVHEETHKDQFLQDLEGEEVNLRNHEAFDQMPISETDPDTWTSGGAKALREPDIIAAMEEAYAVCYDCQEDLAEAAALPYFRAVALTICENADPAWPQCVECYAISWP